MIKVEHLSKSWDDFKLSDINIELPKGYICGLIGENGAGKTTLIQLILGLYSGEEGSIHINGYDLASEECLAKDDMGYVMNEDLFDPYISLEKNADAYGKYYSRYDKKVFLDYCKRFELDTDKKLKKLSKGQKLKFQFAFALSHFPKLLILDEPTASFDPNFRKEFFKVLSEFIEDGEKSVLLSTHLTSDLERVGDYITFLHKGKLVFSKDRESLENSYRLLSGDEYKLNVIPKDRIIHVEKKNGMMTALVRYSERHTYDNEIIVNVPTIEEIMYHYIKEGAYV